jgi:two-component system sensor histidine kinase RegB
VAEWTSDEIHITIADDGPGFATSIIGRLGEPYVTTRPRFTDADGDTEFGGMGLGYFIAKTLLERSSGTLTLENREFPDSGAIVRVTLKQRMGDGMLGTSGI